MHLVLPLALALPAQAQTPVSGETATDEAAAALPEHSRSGLEIHRRFLDHLASPDCRDADPRWQHHYARAPRRMASADDELMGLFGYVVDEMVKAGLPTEYALIPFIESRYNPAAKSSAGPAGMWQFIALTARNQGIPMRADYDGRYSVVESTRAAVRYLRTLHTMFGENWQLAIMGYNAGEYRILGAIRRSGQNAKSADIRRIDSGIPAITRAYVDKLHAISCLIKQADDRPEWVAAIDRPVPRLVAHEVSEGAPGLRQWAEQHALDAALLARLNPHLAQGPLRKGPLLLAPETAARREAPARRPVPDIIASGSAAAALAGGTVRQRPATHTVQSGDTLWHITRRYGISSAELLRRNNLKPGATLRPGMVLKLDESRP